MGWTRGSVASTIRLVSQQQRMEIARRVKAEMDRQGMSSVRLARRADISEKTVSRLINARFNPSDHTLERIADALGVSDQYLRVGDIPPPQLHAGGTDRLTQIEATLAELVDQVSLLRAELQVHDLEAKQQIDIALQTSPRSQRRQRG
jgi:transcriptional regulator with XRE-family HTH domain